MTLLDFARSRPWPPGWAVEEADGTRYIVPFTATRRGYVPPPGAAITLTPAALE